MLDVIACAKPVIGTINPALALETKLSKNPIAVDSDAKNINITIIIVVASLCATLRLFSKIVTITCPKNQLTHLLKTQ